MSKTNCKFQFFFSYFLILLILQFFSMNLYSVEPEEFLKNPEQEKQARIISKKIRCLVCQNQSIDDSSAPLAKDLRHIIRNQIQSGNSDDEIYKFLTDRYGDFILLKPPLKTYTFFLWVFPILMFLIGIAIILNHNRKSKKK